MYMIHIEIKSKLYNKIISIKQKLTPMIVMEISSLQQNKMFLIETEPILPINMETL